MSYAVKTAISLPREIFERIEQVRRKSKKSRSEIILEAVRNWFKTYALKDREEQYTRGYHQHPEEKEDCDALFKSGLTSWHKEEW